MVSYYKLSDETVKLWNLDLDNLQVRGCNWVGDYLQNNPNVKAGNKRICEGIVTKK